MIRGIVTDWREALVRLAVLGPRGGKRSIEAVIDTGFDGFLTMPSQLIRKLGLKWRRRSRAQMADGSDIEFDVYEAHVLWDERSRRIEIDEAEANPMLGMRLLEGFELNMKVRSGGAVSIRKLRK
jgi:clan AA aspartic protease